MTALREAQPFIDQGGHPLVLERNERTDAKFPRDCLGFPRVPAQQIGQRERLGHADRSAREESLEREEVLGVRSIGLIATFEDGAADEVRSRCDRLSLGHRRALRTRAGGYSFCRKIIRQMTKFPATVEIGGEGRSSGIAAVTRVPTSEADDLAVPFESRAAADVTRLVRCRSRDRERVCGVRRRPHADGPWRSQTKSLTRSAHARSPGKASRATIAALRPGAPVTPPPGCALLPQRYRPRTGVR